MTDSAASFSKLSKLEKIDFIASSFFKEPTLAKNVLRNYWNTDEKLQQLHDDFIENTISNFYLPLGVAPHFSINGNEYFVPMVIEESSVVAAAAKAAKFWKTRGGFSTRIIGQEKIGQVHFTYNGASNELQDWFANCQSLFREETAFITKNMEKRGGGILAIELRNATDKLPNYYQLHATFDTKDSMGANFINSCLEHFAAVMRREADKLNGQLDVIMSILSNYVTNCVVEAKVSCSIAELKDKGIDDPELFAKRFKMAVDIARAEPYRAVTHNKGIMNGIDAVVLATGNDFRAIEAAAHAYAARDGQYRSLSFCELTDTQFTFGLQVPLALGTVGGLTSLHPLVKFSLELLKNPSAAQLMEIVAATGLAQNFAALRSLTTTGIQAGHMKMHLNNILNQLEANSEERKAVQAEFNGKAVSHAGVHEFIDKLRQS